MKDMLNKFLNMLGFGEEDEDDDDEIIPMPRAKQSTGGSSSMPALSAAKKGKIININPTVQLAVVVVQPESFEDSRDIADNLKKRNAIVINLEDIERDEARRIVDFLSGASYSLDCNIQKVSNNIFLITPYNVGIMGDFKDELRNKGIFPFGTKI